MSTREVVNFLQPQSLSEAIKAAELLANSTMIPEQYIGKPGDIIVAGQYAAELGISWLQGLQNIAVINGRPVIWGDLALALVVSHPDYEWHREEWDEETQTATCTIKRRNVEHPFVQRFSMEDAHRAGLTGKATKLYQKYPRRMCQMRARSWAIRDSFPDALKGIQVAEEVIDITPEPEPQPVEKTGVEGLKEVLKQDQRPAIEPPKPDEIELPQPEPQAEIPLPAEQEDLGVPDFFAELREGQ